MSAFHLYCFNGSTRPNKPMNAMLADFRQREEFMERLHEDRRNRQINSKKKAAAIKIQAAYRGYRARQMFRDHLRREFTSSGPTTSVDSLEKQILRLAIFFRAEKDFEKTVKLCSDAIQLTHTENASQKISPRRRRQLLRCAIASMPHFTAAMPRGAPLRFFELFLHDEDCVYAVSCGYYASVLSLFASTQNLPLPLRSEDSLPQAVQSLFQILLLPISGRTLNADVVYDFFKTLCQPRFEYHSVCFLVPFISKKFATGQLGVDEFVIALYKKSDQFTEIDTQQTALLGFYFTMWIMKNYTSCSHLQRNCLLAVYESIVRLIPPPEIKKPAKTEEDSDSDDDMNETESVSTDLAASSQQFATPGYYKWETVCTIVNFSVNEKYVTKALQSASNASPLCTLAHFVQLQSQQQYTVLTNSLTQCRQLIPSLWTHISSMTTSTNTGITSLLALVEKGMQISEKKERHLIPALSLFVTLFTNILHSVDDDDFLKGTNASTSMPLCLRDVSNIVLHCRDLTLGLIELAFPVNAGRRRIQENTAISEKWSGLFKSVAQLTRALNERDSRLHFMPKDFWSNHNRNVVITSSLWRAEPGRRRLVRQPFQFVRFLVSGEEAPEPPNPVELRNLTILNVCPFVVPFMQRVEIFSELLSLDRAQNHPSGGHDTGYHLEVRRNTLYENAFRGLSYSKVPDFRRKIHVHMVNWLNVHEAGVDGGGIFREFLTEVLQTALDPSRGFFTFTHDQLLYPNPLASKLYPDFEDHFFFIGRLIGKLLYEGMLADITFADFFLQQLMGNNVVVLDLESVKTYDPLIHTNLKYLKQCSPEEVDGLDLDFSVLIDNFGAMEQIDLKKDGRSIKVTAENRLEYISLYVNYFLVKRLAPMTISLRAGLRNVLDMEWLRMFSASEISMLIAGTDREIDFSELKRITHVYNANSDYDKMYMDSFWMLINEFSPEEKRKFLKFVTGCPRPPIMGFARLNPPMGIQLVHQTNNLPTAATCMNLLKLPLYKDIDTLRSRLKYAINSAAGFELS